MGMHGGAGVVVVVVAPLGHVPTNQLLLLHSAYRTVAHPYFHLFLPTSCWLVVYEIHKVVQQIHIDVCLSYVVAGRWRTWLTDAQVLLKGRCWWWTFSDNSCMGATLL